MFRLLVISCFISIGAYGANFTPNTAAWPTQLDSVSFRVEQNVTKEMTSPGQDVISRLLGATTLTAKDGKRLLKKMSKKSSYAQGSALLSHFNLIFSFYNGDQLMLTTHISTLTRNISHYQENQPEYHGRMSQAMGNYLIRMLYKFRFYERVQNIGDLEGFGR